MMAMTPQEIAERCTEVMWPDDHAARGLGITILSTIPGGATVNMPVRQDMVNGHGICHGGFIFALADTNFAYACNSFNHRTVAAGVDINFVAPAHLGDTLTAVGSMRHQGGRSGIYDIEVTNQDGKTIAVFRGRSTRIKGNFFRRRRKSMNTHPPTHPQYPARRAGVTSHLPRSAGEAGRGCCQLLAPAPGGPAEAA
jgi:acyl-CoA thioesterase